MSHDERAFFFDCDGDALPGIVAVPERAPEIGVLIVVGGPQYRAGSHRQFVALARELAEAGIACMRFDCRGMGDGAGEPREFDDHEDDIRAALQAFRRAVPALRRVVLLGLCDGATAAALYAGAGEGVDGLVLINPWVRTEEGGSRTVLRHYYARRFLDVALWRKLASGQLGVRNSLRQFVANTRKSLQSAYQATFRPAIRQLPDRMLDALQRADCPCLVVLSGRDFVAREFEDSMRKLAGFGELVASGRVELQSVPVADHTFSDAGAARILSEAGTGWLIRAIGKASSPAVAMHEREDE